MDANVGNILFHDVMSSILSKEGILFYSQNYVVPKEDGGFGCLEERFLLPLLSIQEWPTPDAWVAISLKTKMTNDTVALFKYTQASRLVHMCLACQIHVFS